MSYFAELFGPPDVTRVVMRHGQEERLEIFGLQNAAETIRAAWELDTADPQSAAFGMPVAPDTIDIDYEEVD